ncbi:acyl-CoA thioesterase [Crenobacter cavernae]|uniref:Thioesterase n=1 Tax=Crenobacter cavernae TaxID=2290923 RepID=A0ABY0FAE3_9NEIS|nr:thioesterase family protein [Crenobacter cavernae]RXZ42631.1 thioesterase [Crenobacter cavernae]
MRPTCAHEARLQFLESLGYTELAVEGVGIIMTDAAAQYKAEAFHGDALTFELALTDFHKYGFDLLYRVVDDKRGVEVARLKAGIVCFDYARRKIARLPEGFARRFEQEQGGQV